MIYTSFGIIATLCVLGAGFVGTALITSAAILHMRKWEQ